MNILYLPDLTTEELAQAATGNMLTHFSYAQEQTAGMRIIHTDDLFIADSGLPCDTFNVICGASLEPFRAPQRIRDAIGYFAGVNRPFSWWVNPGDAPSNLGELLAAAGLQPAEKELAMVADLNRLRVDTLSPEGLEVRRVQTEVELKDFARIVAANWTPPDVMVEQFYERAAPALLRDDSPLWYYVGYAGDTPAAASELAFGGGVVGLYSICTLAEFRGRGFGTALTIHPLLDALAQGYHTAILQGATVNIYRRAGFNGFGRITEYKPA